MLNAIGMFWQALYSLCFAVNESASAIAAVSTVANEEAEGFRDQMRIERQARIAKITAKLEAERKSK